MKNPEAHHPALLIFICFCLVGSLSAPAQELDSLEIILGKPGITVDQRITICDNLSWDYLSIDFNKSRHFARKGIELAISDNNHLMAGTLYRNLGVAYYMASKLDSANIFFDKAIEFARLAGDGVLETKVDLARANLYNLNGQFKEALELYLKSLPVIEALGQTLKVSLILSNIGVVYEGLKNYELAEKYYLKSEKLTREVGDSMSLGSIYNCLGNFYSAKKEYEKAMKYALESEKIGRALGDIQIEALASQTISEVYYVYYKDFKRAEEHALNGLRLAEELGYPGNIAAMQNSLSNIYYHQGRYNESKEYALASIATDTTDLNLYSNMAANVVRASIQTGDTVLALRYFDLYRRAIDFRANTEYQHSLIEMEVRYESEKKELKLVALEKQKRLGIGITVLGAIGSILLVLSLYFRHRNISHKRHLAEQKVLQLEQEKQLVATQAVLRGETKERARIARDLHDGLGGMLSVVKLKLVDMKGNLILPESDVPLFQNAVGLLDKSIVELRRVARNLMPESLLRYGLKAALNDFCSGVEQVKLHFYGEERRYEERLEIALFRIVQELINNAIKHSEASEINVQLIYEDNRLNLVVQDNGKGFDVEQAEFADTTGLKSIRSRVESLNGNLDLLSSPGKGTEVHVDFLV